MSVITVKQVCQEIDEFGDFVIGVLPIQQAAAAEIKPDDHNGDPDVVIPAKTTASSFGDDS